MVHPTAARLMQATRARYFRPGMNNQWGFVFRENRVPYYQRLLQRHDGKRQWWKSSRSAMLLYPFYTMMWGSFAAAMYGTMRMIWGHKTWY